MQREYSFSSGSLESCIRKRHSVRFFKPDPVPDKVLHECLSLAQLAPSNSNMQNWRITFARGAARDRVIEALFSEAQNHGPAGIPPLPEKYKHFRSDMGHALYGPEGYDIPRSDKAGLNDATMRNFRFFDAPMIGVIHMDAVLTTVDALSVGMFVQTFMLALTDHGLGTCLQVSVTGFPELLKREFRFAEIEEDQTILCGIAVGYPAENSKVNELEMSREDLRKGVRILDD